MITLEFVRSHLYIDRMALDDELAIHAQITEEINREVAKANTAQLEAKRRVDIVEAKVISELKSHDPKLTNPIAEKEAKQSIRYSDAWRSYQEARQLHEEWVGAQDAWSKKGYGLRELGALFVGEYFAVNSIRTPRNMKRIRKEMREKTGDFSRPEPKQDPYLEGITSRRTRRSLADD